VAFQILGQLTHVHSVRRSVRTNINNFKSRFKAQSDAFMPNFRRKLKLQPEFKS
jgi:hypothetical protein